MRWYPENRIPKILKQNPQNPESISAYFADLVIRDNCHFTVEFDAINSYLEFSVNVMHSTNVASKSRFDLAFEI